MPVDIPNFKIAEQNKVVTELKLGRYAGPYVKRPIPLFRVSPIALVPKKKPGGIPVIKHLFHPKGYSMNDFILDEACKVEYSKFDNAVELVARIGKSAELAKSDIKSAFRLLFIAFQDFELFGIKFDGKYYIDKCLLMGVRCALAYFEKILKFFEYCVREIFIILSVRK